MFLYYIIISPLKQLLEIFYILFYEFTYSEGFSVIGLSFIVTLCCLPLYVIAESWQEKERNIQTLLAPGVKRIKQTFRGDEQYMMLATFYRQHRYHPIMALRSSFGLLIQIPFFIAAYSYLSNLQELQGISFFFIKDMGTADALFSVGRFPVNVLPIAMTVINCVAGAVYAKGHGIKEKIQIFAMAAIFLVLLYNSPAGLVLYWTMNNLLSLVKNIFYKFKHPVRVLYAVSALCAVFLLAVAIFFTHIKPEMRAMLTVTAVTVILSPLIVRLLRAFTDTYIKNISGTFLAASFLLSAGILVLLTGFTVPSMLMESEPDNFCFVDSYSSPFIFLFITFCKAFGFYLFWPACFYGLFSLRIKKLISLCALFSATYAVINTFAFSGAYGPIDQTLTFMEPQSFSVPPLSVALNIVCAFVIFALAMLLFKKKNTAFIPYSYIVLIGLAGIAIKNGASISGQYKKMTKPVVKESIEPIFHLSKTGKNVLVFMQDRAFMPMVQDVFEEAPELAKKFDGFIFYKNAVSFAQYTMLGTPGIFGGYDYTPYEINRRTEKTLQQKHNEALLSLPVLFSQNGFSATIADMPYENYLEQPVSDMYKDYPEIRHVYAHGSYSDFWYKKNNFTKLPYISDRIKHNFIMFGIFKTFPPFLRRLVYHNVWWNSENENVRHTTQFINNYSELDLLPLLCDVTSESDSYIAIDNEATHEPMFLQAPDYVPVNTVTDYGTTKWAHSEQYHAQAGVFRCYARFFDWLKENDIYDNTRIIIVSDHGADIETGMFDNTNGVPPYKKESIVACLLFKDFNARTLSDNTTLQEDMTFMTNADIGALASKDIITDAKNPFTGTPFIIPPPLKNSYVKICHPRAESTRNRNNTQFIIPDNDWYTVRDDIFDSANWKQLHVVNGTVTDF